MSPKLQKPLRRNPTAIIIANTVLCLLFLKDVIGIPTEDLASRKKSQDPLLEGSGGDAEERSANPVDASPHEFPSFLVGFSPAGCRYSLIRRRWGLTAAHCVPSQNLPNMPEEYVALAGAHNHRIEEEGQERSGILKGIRHPDFAMSANDIALIKFQTPFNFSDKIQPSIFPPKDYAGLDCVWAVGSRRHCVENVSVNCTKSPYVQKVDLPIIANEKCLEYFEEWPYFNGTTSFCAGYDEGLKSICHGDSGGPVYLIKDGKPIQVGVTAALPSTTCAEPKIPGVFTRVTAYMDWIEETIRKEEELDPTPEQ